MPTDLSPAILKKIARLYEEEEVDVYTMMLYCMDSDDMNYFEEKDRERIRRIFKILTEDTRKHSNILKRILEGRN